MRKANLSSLILLSILLTLTTPAAAQLTFQPTSADFGQVEVDTLRTITLELTSGIVQDVTLSGLSAPYTVTPELLSFTAVNETKTLVVEFHPQWIGSFGQTLTATGSIWGTGSVPVNGEGVAVALSAAAGPLEFGTVSINQSASLDFLVTNTGVGDLVVFGGSSPDPQFAVAPDTFSVLQGQSVAIPITFTPALAGVQSSVVSFQTNAPADHLISVSCTGSGVSNVSGDVFGVWTFANSPYRLVGNATVQQGKRSRSSPVSMLSLGWKLHFWLMERCRRWVRRRIG